MCLPSEFLFWWRRFINYGANEICKLRYDWKIETLNLVFLGSSICISARFAKARHAKCSSCMLYPSVFMRKCVLLGTMFASTSIFDFDVWMTSFSDEQHVIRMTDHTISHHAIWLNIP